MPAPPRAGTGAGRLLDAVTGVFYGRFLEGADQFRFDPDVNVDKQPGHCPLKHHHVSGAFCT
jgi:hypothetical protein